MSSSSRRGLSRRALCTGALSGILTAGAGCQRGGPTRASLWFSYGGRNRQTLERLLRRFNRKQSRYYIDGVFQGDYYEGLAKLRLGLAASRGPSLSHVIAEVVPYLDHAGVLEPLGSYPGAKQLDVLPTLGQVGTWVGGSERELCALPFNRSTPITYFDGELFERHHERAPTTWEELRGTARALIPASPPRLAVPSGSMSCPPAWCTSAIQNHHEMGHSNP